MITRERYQEWLELPITKELIEHLKREETVWRSALGAGAGIRGKSLEEAGVAAMLMNSKADCFRTMYEEMGMYKSIVGADRQEPEDGQDDLEEGEGEGLVSPGSSWSPAARAAIRSGKQ